MLKGLGDKNQYLHIYVYSFMVYCWLAIYNHWTGLVDWTGGLDWWTDTKNHFYASNEIQMLIGLHDAPQNNLLLSLVPRPLPYFISQLWKKNREKAWDQNCTKLCHGPEMVDSVST